jgi:SAM-dependent methyltransferase
METRSPKQMQHETWTSAAPGWRRNDAQLRGFMGPVSERMVRDLRPGQRVLDVASGTGEPALEAAARVAPGGSVLGTDFVAEMLDLAREKAAQRGLHNVEFRLSDGELLDVPAASFDAATMRFGLMFMPDPVAALTRMHRALKPGGSVVLAVWAAPDENPWASLLIDVLRRHLDVPAPPPGAPGLFAFADPDRLRATVTAAGFHDVKVEKLSFTMADFPTGKAFVAYQMDLAGPIAQLFAKLPEAKRSAVTDEMAREAEQVGGIPVRLLGLTWIATGHA